MFPSIKNHRYSGAFPQSYGIRIVISKDEPQGIAKTWFVKPYLFVLQKGYFDGLKCYRKLWPS